ncbi:ABC transporter permease, partial [Rhizobiaceae sp. 2RAB30]
MTVLSATRWPRLTQETIVLLFTVVMFAALAMTLGGFLSTDNLVTLVRSVWVLGLLCRGMGLVVIGGGI